MMAEKFTKNSRHNSFVFSIYNKIKYNPHNTDMAISSLKIKTKKDDRNDTFVIEDG